MPFIDLGLTSKTKWSDSNLQQQTTAQTRGLALPTVQQFEELFSECKITKEDNALCFTGPNGNSVRLPFEGYGYPICDTKADIPEGQPNPRKYHQVENGWGYYRTADKVGFHQVCAFIDQNGGYEMRATENTYRMSCRTILKSKK